MVNASPSADVAVYTDSNLSGISWAAVIGGAFVSAALWLTLTILGVGLGLSAVSPWVGAGARSETIRTSTIIWLIVTQIIASGLGGYLAGRLRLRWQSVPADEVYFRDTAHGLLMWAVGVVIAAAFLSSAFSLILTSGTNLAPMAAATGALPGVPGGTYRTAPERYTTPAPGRETTPTPGMETTPAPGDRESVPGAPGTPRMEETPVPQSTVTKEDVDKARKAAAKASIWIFVALLIGAFCASVAAIIGGRQRDKVVYYEGSLDVEEGRIV